MSPGWSSPGGLLATAFAATILVGTVLLRLPICQNGTVGWSEALFTATSAVCVTGLVVVDTGTAFTPLGQAVILVLIQIGGIGVMTFAAVGLALAGRNLGLRSLAAVQDALFQRDLASGVRVALRRVLLVTFAAEGAGALALLVGLRGRGPFGQVAFSALFHAVSAFCNAGFSLYRDNLQGFRGSALVQLVVMGLIVVGGLGFPVILELAREARSLLRGERVSRGSLSLHARLVLWASLGLIVGGALLLLALDLERLQAAPLDAVAAALFQSVTARTAGFNTVPIGALPTASLLILSALMFVGGSPGSCAGGVKTTTPLLWLASLRAFLRGRGEVTLGGFGIPEATIRKVHLLLSLAMLWNLAGVVVLTAAGLPEGFTLQDALFEQVSAFGTVGLSTGFTASLDHGARLWIVATMFLGRLGPLTLGTWAIPAVRDAIRLPPAQVMIG